MLKTINETTAAVSLWLTNPIINIFVAALVGVLLTVLYTSSMAAYRGAIVKRYRTRLLGRVGWTIRMSRCARDGSINLIAIQSLAWVVVAIGSFVFIANTLTIMKPTDANFVSKSIILNISLTAFAAIVFTEMSAIRRMRRLVQYPKLVMREFLAEVERAPSHRLDENEKRIMAAYILTLQKKYRMDELEVEEAAAQRLVEKFFATSGNAVAREKLISSLEEPASDDTDKK
ncbi:hypothetical protein [Rhizobium leguminosarum]|uniref:hypothetical protein n=1 Tax=Rhizobium leguminosarum TaxID=384 RepID=UPI0024B35183|nr:hypothetical protein [Rhizobium leguminosarum]WHO79770.1 hypothetical protein QMO81_002465 [Rhizobium leguminosarum]